MELSSYRDRLQELRDSGPRELVREGFHPLLLTALFFFAFWIRMIPARGMKYLQALDPYMISRMSHAVATKGFLPMIDAWRYFPFTTPTYLFNLGDIYIPAYLYNLISFTGIGFLDYARMYPAVAGSLMVVALYFVGKELFDRRTGLLAAFFLAASPAVLHRSSAGWFEKEPLAAFLMFTSIYFVVRAWDRKSWISGILAGSAFGISMTVWGGTRFLTLFYPLVIVPVALMDEDIENLLVAFTPTIILGHFLPAILNPSRWSVPNGPLVMSAGILGLVWIRYYVGKLELVERKNLKYVVPGLSALGVVMLYLAPLYSQTLASYVQSVKHKALQSGGAVVAGTVAENQPAQAGQIVGQLGAYRAGGILPNASVLFSELFSGWTFSLIGTAALTGAVSYMVLRKYTGYEEISYRAAYALFIAIFSFMSVALAAAIPGSVLYAFMYALAVALVGSAVLFLSPPDGELRIDGRWYLVIPLLWIASTLYGATQRSRLLFLTSQPVALMAGYGLSTGMKHFRRSGLWDYIGESVEQVDRGQAFRIAVGLFLVPVLLFNGAAAYSMAQGIGGSPNQAWMENLEFMREETPVDSVVLSWWDYGYWFETIGGRAAIADGGNLQFYNDAFKHHIINMPLADFLTAENTTRYMDWLKSYSVDYVVLDSSMIGKYSAVSQIHHRSNKQFNAMQTPSCSRKNGRCQVVNRGNKSYLLYQYLRLDRYPSGRPMLARVLVPYEVRGRQPVISGPPAVQIVNGQRRGASMKVAKKCSPSGVETFDVNASTTLPGCVSFHPYRQHTQLVYIPPEVMDSTLVNLYIMDAHGMERFDEVFDNGYVKMWKVDYGGG
ncbi:MAG: STT3 domain-containing protein [Candidatus Nanohaloarchaea archaeon]|nr:STT3 domain-containing protein [Candidatus Nanohaloarchaea archaeon]